MNDADPVEDLDNIIDQADKLRSELSVLFGEETVDLASQLDIADLNVKDEIVKDIGVGVGELKKLKGNANAQVEFIQKLEQGSKLLLCMWIMDMDLLDKIQTRS